MKQLKNYSDSRLEGICVYCGEKPETRDHVPSKILMEKPFPDNLPVVPACLKCNNDFSKDEEYLACLIECTLRGTTEPEGLEREKVKRILERKPILKNQLNEAMRVIDGQIFFRPEEKRLKNVVLKLAKGHATYENSELQFSEPESVTVRPLPTMTETELCNFYTHEDGLFPEVGSRALQRIFTSDESVVNNWVIVQEGKYIYSINHGRLGLSIKFVIWDYLACEVIWN